MRDRALLLRLSLSASSVAAAVAEALAWHLLPIFVAAVVSAIYDTSALQPSLWAAAAALGIFALAARQFLRNLHRNALLAALHRVGATREGRAACARLAEAAHGHVPAAATAALVFASSTAAVFRYSPSACVVCESRCANAVNARLLYSTPRSKANTTDARLYWCTRLHQRYKIKSSV